MNKVYIYFLGKNIFLCPCCPCCPVALSPVAAVPCCPFALLPLSPVALLPCCPCCPCPLLPLSPVALLPCCPFALLPMSRWCFYNRCCKARRTSASTFRIWMRSQYSESSSFCSARTQFMSCVSPITREAILAALS